MLYRAVVWRELSTPLWLNISAAATATAAAAAVQSGSGRPARDPVAASLA